jgi:hypothetical protein
MSNKTPTLRESNPFGISIERILLVKYDRSDEIDITSQFLELNIFQNLFEPTILAEMLIYDAIGLFVNYPLTGEESIIVELANPKGSASPRNTDFFTASADGARFPFGSPARDFFIIQNDIFYGQRNQKHQAGRQRPRSFVYFGTCFRRISRIHASQDITLLYWQGRKNSE